MALDLNKTELRELVRELIQKELKSDSFKKSVKDIVDDSKFMTEKETRDMVRQILVNFYKLMYQRRSFWSNGL